MKKNAEERLAFFRTDQGRVVVVGVLLLAVIVLAVVLAIVAQVGNEVDPQYEPQIDPVSGVTIWNIDEEPEIGDEGPILLGFYQLKDMGLMSAQYQKVVDTITEYVEENYPNAKRVSYAKDSFDYVGEDEEEENENEDEDENGSENESAQSSFKFVIDNSSTFIVYLDTGDSLDNIIVEIEKL